MEDPTSALFQLALGLTPPWRVEKLEFDPARHRLDLYLDFERGSRFACPECARAGCPVHDSTDKEWRHLNFFQHEAYLHARVPRVRCEDKAAKASETASRSRPVSTRARARNALTASSSSSDSSSRSALSKATLSGARPRLRNELAN